MPRRRAAPLLGALLVGAACAQPQPGPVPPQAVPTAVGAFVSAPVSITWDAAIAYLDESSIPMTRVEWSAGLIETERVAVRPSDAADFADCGSELASTVAYRVAVIDEGSSSTVLVTAFWETGASDTPSRCASTRIWEGEMQEAIALQAEVNR